MLTVLTCRKVHSQELVNQSNKINIRLLIYQTYLERKQRESRIPLTKKTIFL